MSASNIFNLYCDDSWIPRYVREKSERERRHEEHELCEKSPKARGFTFSHFPVYEPEAQSPSFIVLCEGWLNTALKDHDAMKNHNKEVNEANQRGLRLSVPPERLPLRLQDAYSYRVCSLQTP